MELVDRALILNIQTFNENDALVSAFTRGHGLVKGMAKRALTSRHRGTYCVGNWVDLRWYARLEEHLGNIECELVVPTGSMLMRERQRCYVLQSMCALILLAFEQRDPHPKLFRAMDRLIEALQFDLPWPADYARFEAILLQETGYGLGLDACIVTGETQQLAYVSPKSGCAVSKRAGADYHHKLFAFPSVLVQEMHSQAKPDAVEQALSVTGYFIAKWLLPALDKPMPAARERLLNSMRQNVQEPV